MIPLAAVLASLPVHADTPALEIPPPSAGWEFRAEPYGWLTSVDGTVGVRGFTTGIDADFFDDLLDHLEMVASLQVEARHGRWGIIADGFYSELGFSGETPGLLYESVSADYRQFFGELALAYRVHEDPCLFVDVYAGARYTGLELELVGRESPPDISSFSSAVSDRIVEGAIDRADAIVEPKLEAYRTAMAAERTVIEGEVRSAVEAAAEKRAEQILRREIARIHDGKRVHLKLRELARDIARQRAEMAAAAAKLKVAELRASVNAALQSKVDQARSRLARTEKDLAKSIRKGISEALTTRASGDEQWIDPFLGVRTQWNFSEKWFLAAKGDIGGFGVGADLAWSLQATLGYRFTDHVSAELGYRHMLTDYHDGGFTNDVNQAGIYTGLNLSF